MGRLLKFAQVEFDGFIWESGLVSGGFPFRLIVVQHKLADEFMLELAAVMATLKR